MIAAEVWAKLVAVCKALQLSIDEAIDEKASELTLRHFLLCLPNGRLKAEQIPAFLTEVLGEKPSLQFVERVSYAVRGPRISEDDYLAIEREQNGRCALCGSVLGGKAGAHVDHIMPVALHGKSEVENYQLLCAECNLGKSKMPGWILSAPYLREGITPRMKYCVLTRFHGRCCVSTCSATARLTELELVPRIPVQRGGRPIFDNLEALCREHADERRHVWLKDATAKVESSLTRLLWHGG